LNRTLSRLLNTTAAAVLAVVILAGCTNTQADLKPGTAEKLQERLQSLARSAADKDFPAASSELDLLAIDASTAAANGEFSPARRQDIQNAIDLIRADLAAMTPDRTPTVHAPAPADPQPPGIGKGKDKDKSK
jgi:hypothetical protein